MKRGLVLLFAVCALALTACGKKEAAQSDEKAKITIAYQYGSAYAPAQIMQAQEYLSKRLPNTKIEWKVFSSGAAINEGVVSGDIDIAMMGVAPFLIGWDKGVPYKIYSAISSQPMGLITYDENIKSLKDFKAGDKIAVVSYGSIQHIVLAMAAEKQLGDMHAMDDFIVNMAHPDGMQALISKQEVKGHMTTSPYYNQELDMGFHEVISAEEAFQDNYSLIIGLASNDFYTKYPKMYEALCEATKEAMDYINSNLEETAAILAKNEGIETDTMLGYLQTKGSGYQTETVGVLNMAEFMKRAEFISKQPKDMSEVAFENLLTGNSN